MDRETAITRALGAFWREIETIYPRSYYEAVSADTFERLRDAADSAICERVDRNVVREITDEVGNVDLCECEPGWSTRVIRVIRRTYRAELA